MTLNPVVDLKYLLDNYALGTHHYDSAAMQVPHAFWRPDTVFVHTDHIVKFVYDIAIAVGTIKMPLWAFNSLVAYSQEVSRWVQMHFVPKLCINGLLGSPDHHLVYRGVTLEFHDSKDEIQKAFGTGGWL